MKIEEKLGSVIKEKGIRISVLSRNTGIKYMPLRSSLKGKRHLRANEFITICKFLEIDINELVKEGEGGE